jgi:hypothetical protein
MHLCIVRTYVCEVHVEASPPPDLPATTGRGDEHCSKRPIVTAILQTERFYDKFKRLVYERLSATYLVL